MNILTYLQNVNGGRMILEAMEAKKNKDGFKCLTIIRGLGISVTLNLMELQHVRFSKTDTHITVYYDNKHKSTLVTNFPVQLHSFYAKLVEDFNERAEAEVYSIQNSAVNVTGDLLPNCYSVWANTDYKSICEFLNEVSKYKKQGVNS